VRVGVAVRATAYLGTPSFLYTLLKRGRELGSPLGIEVAFVTAEMLPESLRAEVENDFGVRLLQGYGTADLGLLAYECPEKGGMHLHPEAIVEVLDLETGKPAAPGQPGEIVATIFDPAYPLIRFATGDIGALAQPVVCACQRTAPKLAGLVGRVGDAVKVKGMFIRGAEIEKALKAFPDARPAPGPPRVRAGARRGSFRRRRAPLPHRRRVARGSESSRRNSRGCAGHHPAGRQTHRRSPRLALTFGSACRGAD